MSADEFAFYAGIRDLEKVPAEYIDRTLEVSCDLIQRLTGRYFTPLDDEAKSFDAQGLSQIRIPDLRWTTPNPVVAIDGTAISRDLGYEIAPDGITEPATHMYLAERPMYPQGGVLTITGDWGWSPVPPVAIDAAYTVAARKYRERNAAFADQVLTPEGLTLAFFRQLPASIRDGLNALRVPKVAFV